MADESHDQAPDDEPAAERWVFGGSRISAKKQRLHAWVDADGEELWFKPKGSYAVGSIYQVQVSRLGEGRITRHGEPRYAGGRAEPELYDSLSAQHRAAEAELGLLARERAAKKDDPVELAIERLLELSRKAPAAQRTAFLAYVIARLTRSWL
jgi:hypothetical protein